jgi:hypothetical protein
MKRHLKLKTSTVAIDLTGTELHEVHRLDLPLCAFRALSGSTRLGQQQPQLDGSETLRARRCAYFGSS